MSRLTRYDPRRTKVFGVLVVVMVMALLLGAANLYMLGSVIVRDADGSVAEVFLRDSDSRIGAHQLLGRIHATTAKLEGEAIVRCRTGKTISLGYITSGWHIRQTVRAADCNPKAPAVLNN